MSIDYKHTVRVDRNAWFIRFYCWLWEASTSQINVCKLFWGYVFLPLGLFLRLVVIPVIVVLDRISAGRSKARTDRMMSYTASETKPKPPKAGPNRMQAVLNAIADFFSRLSMHIGSGIYRLRQHTRLIKVLGRALLALALAAGLAALGLLVYFAVKYFDTTLVVLLVIGGTALTLVVIAILYGIGFLEAAWDRVVRPGGRGVGLGIAGFFRVLALGFVAVKSNTCPKIEVVEEAKP